MKYRTRVKKKQRQDLKVTFIKFYCESFGFYLIRFKIMRLNDVHDTEMFRLSLGKIK